MSLIVLPCNSFEGGNMSLIEPEFEGWWRYFTEVDSTDLSPELKLMLRLLCEKVWVAAVERMVELNSTTIEVK